MNSRVYRAKVWVPESFDLEKHLQDYPPQIANFKKKKLLYIMSLIYLIPSWSTDNISSDGFVPLSSEKLARRFKDYKVYLDYLVETGVFYSNNHYEPNVSSRKYKYSYRYSNDEPVQYQFDKPMAYQTREYIRQQRLDEEMENYLYNWYNEGKLKINYHSARSYSNKMKDLKMKRLIDWDINTKTGKKKYPVQQYHSSLINMNGLNVQDYNAHRDNEIHRLHSRLTSLQKECRNFVSYDNTELASIDISNSQPYLMCLLFNPLFWQQDSNIPLNFYSLPANIQNRFSPDLISKVRECVEKLDVEEVKNYKWNASNGIMYEYIMDRAESIGLILTRKKAKEMMLTVFFSKNGFFHQKGAELKRLFDKLHPSIYGLIKLIKSNNHADFACLLQVVESTIILNRCCWRIWEEAGHQIPVFTIHDSIATTVEYQDYVRHIMEDELTKTIGIKPNLKIETWHISNLHDSNKLCCING